ncbi:MAG: hypothetical protein ACKOHM_03345 [Spartobacteria bacterium]
MFDPNRDADEMLLVNFTTLREKCVDDACILDDSDYVELKYETTLVLRVTIIAGDFFRIISGFWRLFFGFWPRDAFEMSAAISGKEAGCAGGL